MDTMWIRDSSLSYQQTYAGIDLAIPELQDLHYDIIDITVPKLINCTRLYQDIAKRDPDAETYIIRYPLGEIKSVINQALDQRRLMAEKIPKQHKKELGIS